MDVIIHEVSIIMKFYKDMIENFEMAINSFPDMYFLTLFGATPTLSGILVINVNILLER
jgi:hypothetical protein